MKQYHNGPRKAMAYGGNVRKPMMYGGMSNNKPRKNAQAGGMMSAPQQTKPEDYAGIKPAMGMPMMAQGGTAMLGDLDKNGKMSKYETARQKAIEKNMKKA